MVQAFVEKHERLLDSFAPVAGAAGGALAVTALVERLGVERKAAAFGTAAIGLVIAERTTGVAKQAATGFAAAGICLGVIEAIREARPGWIYGEKAPEPPPRQAAPPDAITREEMQRVIAEVVEQQAKAHAAQIEELRATIGELLAQLREARGRAPAAAAPPTPNVLSPKQVEHLRTVGERLTEEEHQALARVQAETPPEVARQVEEAILCLPVEQAIAFLRDHVLRNGAPPNDHAR